MIRDHNDIYNIRLISSSPCIHRPHSAVTLLYYRKYFSDNWRNDVKYVWHIIAQNMNFSHLWAVVACYVVQSVTSFDTSVD